MCVAVGQCMDHFTSFLKGPPNKPTVDECGFLPIILHFFESVRGGVEERQGREASFPSCPCYGPSPMH